MEGDDGGDDGNDVDDVADDDDDDADDRYDGVTCSGPVGGNENPCLKYFIYWCNSNIIN